MLSVRTVTSAKLHTLIGVGLTGFSGAVSGCGWNAIGTHAFVHSGVLMSGRGGERGLFWLESIQKAACIKVITKEHAILQQHCQLYY